MNKYIFIGEYIFEFEADIVWLGISTCMIVDNDRESMGREGGGGGGELPINDFRFNYVVCMCRVCPRCNVSPSPQLP